MTKKIGVLVGSLRPDSFNKKIAENVIELLPEGYEAKLVEIGNLPLYSEEYDTNEPAEYANFRSEIESFDAILFQTPEYNRSVPGVLKNAIDVGSRPWGESKWAGKPAAVFSATPGGLGAFGANHHLRQTLAFLDMPTMGQPEVYLSGVADMLDESGKVTEETKEYLQGAVDAFVAHIEKNL